MWAVVQHGWFRRNGPCPSIFGHSGNFRKQSICYLHALLLHHSLRSLSKEQDTCLGSVINISLTLFSQVLHLKYHQCEASTTYHQYVLKCHKGYLCTLQFKIQDFLNILLLQLCLLPMERSSLGTNFFSQCDLASVCKLQFISGEGRTQRKYGRKGTILFGYYVEDFAFFFERPVVHHKCELFQNSMTGDLSHFFKIHVLIFMQPLSFTETATSADQLTKK